MLWRGHLHSHRRGCCTGKDGHPRLPPAISRCVLSQTFHGQMIMHLSQDTDRILSASLILHRRGDSAVSLQFSVMK